MARNLHFSVALCLILSTCAAFGAGVELEQELVIGFPVDGVGSVLPYVVGREGHHRLALVHSAYLLGLQWSPRSNGYEQRFFVQGDFGGIAVMADVDGDRDNEIVIVDTFDEKITAWDATNGAAVDSFAPDVDPRGAAAQDLDGVPGHELILTTHNSISAYRGGILFWQSRIASEVQVAAGGEGSASRDIVITTRDEMAVLDARTGVERRRYPIRCFLPAVGQTDADASLEIACYSFDMRTISVVDANSGTVQWSRQEWIPFFDVRSVAMVDAGGDGAQDVAVRTYGSSTGVVMVLNGVSGEPIARRELEWGGVVASVPFDCGSAMVVTEGSGTTAPDLIHLVDAMTLQTKSSFSFGSYGIKAMAAADLNGDRRNEVLVHHSGQTTTLSVQPFLRQTIRHGASCCTFAGTATAQLDGDRALEYLLTGVVDGYTGTVTAFDGVTHEMMWTAEMDDGEVPRSIEVADLNGDGRLDVISATVAVHSGAKGQFVYAFDGATGRRLWRSVNIFGLTGHALVADIDANGTPDVLALSRTVGIVQLNAANGAVRGFDEFTGGNVFAVLNVDDDAQLEVLVAMEDRLVVRDQGQKTKETLLDRSGVVTSIEVADLDGDGAVEILLARVQTFGLRLEVRARDLTLLWSSATFPRLINFQQEEVIAVADVDNDGSPEVALTSSLALRIFRIGARPVDAIAPRFSPGATVTSQVRVAGSCCASVHLRWDEAEIDASPPLTYEIYRSGPAPQDPEIRIGTTTRNEFVDGSAGGATRYRYSVRLVDAAGNAAPERLTAEVSIRAASTCRRRAARP